MTRTPTVDPLGRAAEAPTDIPAPGWKAIARRVRQSFGDDRVLLVSAGTTFYLLLAMVPALTAMVSLYGLVADPVTIQGHLSSFQAWLPEGGQAIVQDQLNRLTGQGGTRLGVAFGASVGLAFWTANAGMKAMFEAMNVAYGETEKRGFIRLTLTTLAFTVGAVLLLLTLVGVAIVLPLVLNQVGLGLSTERLVRIGSGLALALAALTALSALYRWGPSREDAKWSWITPGAVMAIGVAFIASTAFSWYVANFGSYNETYGSLGAIVGFMTWLWIMVTFIVTGAELNAEMEHQTSRDSTTGPDQPMGQRGARVADTMAGDQPIRSDTPMPSDRPAHEPPVRARPVRAQPGRRRTRPEPVDENIAEALPAMLLLGGLALTLAAVWRSGPETVKPPGAPAGRLPSA